MLNDCVIYVFVFLLQCHLIQRNNVNHFISILSITKIPSIYMNLFELGAYVLIKWNKTPNEIRLLFDISTKHSKTQIAFINNWKINSELIGIWNTGRDSASMVKVSTIISQNNLFTNGFYLFFLSCLYHSALPINTPKLPT